MIRFSVRKSRTSKTKTVYELEMDVEDIPDVFGVDFANSAMKYGAVVELQSMARGDKVDMSLDEFLRTHHVEYRKYEAEVQSKAELNALMDNLITKYGVEGAIKKLTEVGELSDIG